MCRIILLWVMVSISNSMANAPDHNRYDYVAVTLCGKSAVVFAVDKKEGIMIIADVKYIEMHKEYADLALRAMKNTKGFKQIRIEGAVDHKCEQIL